MINATLTQLADVLNAELIGENTNICAVSTDTRQIEPGSLFIALCGERFDAHDFAYQAVDAGAGALLVSRRLNLPLPQLLVKDTRQALGIMGAWVHQQCQAATLAITGSCGKTTVKEMVASILSAQGQVLFTAGNFNNDIGVPLTLLRSTPEDKFAVIELGANHIGEIAYTTQLVKPSVALVNNVAAAHLEGFGSLDGVKVAKGEIFQGLEPGQTAIINLDSQGGEHWNEVLADKVVKRFSVHNQQADYFASDVHLNAEGKAQFCLHTPTEQAVVNLNLSGLHNVSNAVAAAALASEFGASMSQIQQGLSQVSNVKGRVEVLPLSHTLTLIDDSYNASVPAMKAAIDLLSHFDGERWLILGNMAELGDESLALHRQVGEHAAPFYFEHVLTFGHDAQVISEVCDGIHFSSHDEMITYIEQHLEHSERKHTLLIKGAHSAGMSRIAIALKEKFS